MRLSLVLLLFLSVIDVFPWVHRANQVTEIPQTNLYMPLWGSLYPGSYDLETLLQADSITLTSKKADVKKVQIAHYTLLIFSPDSPARLVSGMRNSLETVKKSLTNLKAGDAMVLSVTIIDENKVKWENRRLSKYTIK
jgi:hypothetical protein